MNMVSVSDICKLPSVPGPCLAYFSRWYYDVNAQACESFVYGGCKGNENNFETKEECERQCPGGWSGIIWNSFNSNIYLIYFWSENCTEAVIFLQIALKEVLSVLMLSARSVFIFTSGSSALLHCPCCGLSIWLLVVPKSYQREGQPRKTENELTNDRWRRIKT